MANATEMFTALEDQVLDTVRQGQETIVKAVQTWAEAGKNLVPDLPALPFADQVPSTVDLVENTFAFADRMLATQREFAAAILDAARPMLVKEQQVKTGAKGPASKTTP